MLTQLWRGLDMAAGLSAELKARARGCVKTFVATSAAGILILAGGGFLVAALYGWIALYLPGPLALLAMGGGLIAIGLIVIVWARARARRSKMTARPSTPAAAAAAVERAQAEAIVRQKLGAMSAQSLVGALVLGVVVGLLKPTDGD